MISRESIGSMVERPPPIHSRNIAEGCGFESHVGCGSHPSGLAHSRRRVKFPVSPLFFFCTCTHCRRSQGDTIGSHNGFSNNFFDFARIFLTKHASLRWGPGTEFSRDVRLGHCTKEHKGINAVSIVSMNEIRDTSLLCPCCATENWINRLITPSRPAPALELDPASCLSASEGTIFRGRRLSEGCMQWRSS